MKKFNHTIGNGTRDLLACSAVLQPTAPLRGAQLNVKVTVKVNVKLKIKVKVK